MGLARSNRRYMTITIDEVGDLAVGDIHQKNNLHYRLNTENTKVIIHYDGSTPDSLDYLDDDTTYTHAEMITITKNVGGEWPTAAAVDNGEFDTNIVEDLEDISGFDHIE